MSATPSQSVQGGRHVDQPSSVIAALFVMVLGSLNFPLLPMVVGAITDHLTLSTQQVGMIASADMTGMFLSALCALYWIRRANWRHAAMVLGLGLVACDVIAANLTSFTPLLIVRLVAGFCGGSMMALGGTALTDTKHPERNTSMFCGFQVLIAAAGFLLMPALIARHGTAGAFLFLAAIGLPAVLATRWLPASGNWKGKAAGENTGISSQKSPASRRRIIGLLLLSAMPALLFHVGFSASWAYIERLGLAAGLSHPEVGQALSTSLLFAMVGSLLAGFIDVRFGNLLPSTFAFVFQMISVGALYFFLHIPFVYVVAVMTISFFWTFAVPYLMSFTIKNDQTGRAAVVFLLMLKAGIAIGPYFASNFVSKDNFMPALVIAAIFYTLCFINIVILSLPGRWQKDMPVLSPQP